MIDIFSTRELATGIWFVILLIYCFSQRHIRQSMGNLVKCACVPKISVPFVGIVVYTGLLVFVFKQFSFWNWIYVKDILIWLIFTGVPYCYNAVSANIDEHYFRKIFTDNLKAVVLIEFLTNTFTFNLVVEIIFIPFVTFIFIMDFFAGREDKYKQVKKLTSVTLGIIGISILVFSIKAAIHISDIDEIRELLVSFLIPIIFSLLYIPIAYSFATYSRYEMLFLRMSFKSPKDKKVLNKRKIAIIHICKISVKKIIEFENKCLPYMYVSMSDDDFKQLIENFKNNRRYTA